MSAARLLSIRLVAVILLPYPMLEASEGPNRRDVSDHGIELAIGVISDLGSLFRRDVPRRKDLRGFERLRSIAQMFHLLERGP
jgi:hypothetical protein